MTVDAVFDVLEEAERLEKEGMPAGSPPSRHSLCVRARA
jgi:hypothetical protein